MKKKKVKVIDELYNTYNAVLYIAMFRGHRNGLHYIGLVARKPVFGARFANNTGAEQSAHPRSLISTFVIRFLESIIH